MFSEPLSQYLTNYRPERRKERLLKAAVGEGGGLTTGIGQTRSARERPPGFLQGHLGLGHPLVVLAIRRVLAFAMTRRGRRNGHAADDEPHVVLDVGMIQVQLQER